MSLHPCSYFQTQSKARIRYAYWPCETSLDQCQGTVIIFQGRSSFIEKFSSIAETLVQKGFHVWNFDWRGQGLSTRLIKDRRRGYIDSYETYLSDFHELFTDVISDKVHGPLILLGQSMGCQIALRYLERFPNVIDMAVLTAPMFNLNTGGYKPAIARAFVKTMCKLGFEENYVIGHGSYDPSQEPFEGNMLTHDRQVFYSHRDLQKNNPDLIVGGATYGWVSASFDSIDSLNKPEVLGRLNTPVLIITAGDETVVDNRLVPQIVSWMPDAEHIEYEGARHQILSESHLYLQRFWLNFSRFVDQNKQKNPNPSQTLTKGRFIKSTKFPGMKRVYPTLPNDFNRLESDF